MAPSLKGRGRYAPVPSTDADDLTSARLDANKSNTFDELANPHDLVASDSEDEDWKSEKIRNRQARQRQVQAYDQPPALPLFNRNRLPQWLLRKRVFIPLCLVIGLFIARWSTGYGTAFEPSTLDGQSDPWYPAPLGGTLSRWSESYDKAATLVSRMSLLEKVNVTTGTGWEMGMCVGNTGPAAAVGFPSLCLQDGPLGLRFADNVTAGPAGVTVGATWNADLMYQRGRMLGLEARSKGINVILGPSVGPLGRAPAGGRNWEAFGVDPVLQGVGASMTIRGIQHEGVMATIKHFVANEQEHYRQAWEWGISSAISSNLDDRALHEIYAWPFADSIREGVASVMCSYNQVNNSYGCQNSKLMNGILKDEMGFQGFIQSDWLAQRSGVASALAGLDMSMPGDGEHWADGIPFWGPELTKALLNHTVPIERVDDMVTRIVAAWYLLDQDKWSLLPPNGTGKGPNFSSWTNDREGLIHPGSDDETTAIVNDWVDATVAGGYSHSSLLRRIAAEGNVLLKNDGDFLPLSTNGRSQKAESEDPSKYSDQMRVAVYGEDAVVAEGGPNTCADRACNKGTLAVGWGSGAVEFPYLISPWQALKKEFRSLDVTLRLSPRNKLSHTDRDTRPELQDTCIVFVNADAGEGFAADGETRGDRNDLRLQKGGEALIKEVSSKCGQNSPNRAWFSRRHGNTIVVIHSVGPVILESFIKDSKVGAVLLANLPGQESGNALADVIFGRINPSGHLPYTIAKATKDYGPSSRIVYSSKDAVPQSNFTEGTLIDYRWFDARKITPRFEFGYGLSYTTFEISGVKASPLNHTEHLPDRPEPQHQPPQYQSSLPDPSSAVFPTTWRRLKKFIYPYIDSAEEITPDPDPAYKHLPKSQPGAAGGGEGGHPALWEPIVNVKVNVTNIGERAGQAVVQVYVSFPQGVTEHDEVSQKHANIPFPPRNLRAFEKVALAGSVEPVAPDFAPEKLPDTAPASNKHEAREVENDASKHPFARSSPFPAKHHAVVRPAVHRKEGETRLVSFNLTRRDLSYWSAAKQTWVIPKGHFGIDVGFSSRDIRKTVQVL